MTALEHKPLVPAFCWCLGSPRYRGAALPMQHALQAGVDIPSFQMNVLFRRKGPPYRGTCTHRKLRSAFPVAGILEAGHHWAHRVVGSRDLSSGRTGGGSNRAGDNASGRHQNAAHDAGRQSQV